MGFYSFYRIFKDIFKTFFGKKGFKIFLVILLFVIVFTFYSSKVNASDLRPWNVYTNTTEFNWNRLTKVNYTDNYTHLSYSFYKLSSQQTYYLYNPNSNTGNISLFTYVSNDDNNLLMLYQDSQHQSSYWFEFQYEYNGGYCDIPYNTLFTPQFDCTMSFGNNSFLELYMLDDKYSNIESYNELSGISQDLRTFLYGSDTSMTYNYKSSFIATNSGVFANNDGYDLLYFPVSKGYSYTLTFDCLDTSTNRWARHGYSSVEPSNGVNYSNLTSTLFNQPSNTLDFQATQDGYYYFCFVKGLYNNFSLNSNYVEGMEGGINQQIINQGTETRETLTDSSISQNSSDYTLPTDSTNDITNDGFTSIFDRIRSTFTTVSSTPAVINIPFTNKSFTISKASVFGSANLGIVQTIIEAFWWFVVSVFIVKDIFKKIEKIKTGNIEFTETTNIKEDIL